MSALVFEVVRVRRRRNKSRHKIGQNRRRWHVLTANGEQTRCGLDVVPFERASVYEVYKVRTTDGPGFVYCLKCL